MSVTSVGNSMPRYQVPMTPAAKTDDERTESIAVKQREIATGKDAPAPEKGCGAVVNVKA